MRYKLDITLTEEDYIDFNNFHALESVSGKKQLKKATLIVIIAFAALMVLMLVMFGPTPFSISYAVFLGVFAAVYLLILKKIVKHNIKKNVSRMKKAGKLPFESSASLEFYEDHLVQSSPSMRMEQAYSVLERVCVVQNRFVLLYTSSVAAHIIPMGQLFRQVNDKEFWEFLCQKCPKIEHY